MAEVDFKMTDSSPFQPGLDTCLKISDQIQLAAELAATKVFILYTVYPSCVLHDVKDAVCLNNAAHGAAQYQ
jgi:hypothetical protein